MHTKEQFVPNYSNAKKSQKCKCLTIGFIEVTIHKQAKMYPKSPILEKQSFYPNKTRKGTLLLGEKEVNQETLITSFGCSEDEQDGLAIRRVEESGLFSCFDDGTRVMRKNRVWGWGKKRRAFFFFFYAWICVGLGAL